MNRRRKNLVGVDPKTPAAGLPATASTAALPQGCGGWTLGQFLERRGCASSSSAVESQLEDGIDQSTTKAPTAIIESTAFATSSAGQGMILTEGEGGGGPG